MNDDFNIRITVELGDKTLAENFAKRIAKFAHENTPEDVMLAIIDTFGAYQVSEVQYMPHHKENIGAVVMLFDCSEKQIKAAEEAFK